MRAEKTEETPWLPRNCEECSEQRPPGSILRGGGNCMRRGVCRGLVDSALHGYKFFKDQD